MASYSELKGRLEVLTSIIEELNERLAVSGVTERERIDLFERLLILRSTQAKIRRELITMVTKDQHIV